MRIATPLFAFGKNADVGHSLQVLVDEGDLELVRAFGRFAMTRRGNVRLLRRGKPLPYGGTWVCCVGAGALDGPFVRHASMSAGDRKGRPYGKRPSTS